MNNKLFIGSIILIVLIIGAGIFVYFKNHSDISKLEQKLAEAKAVNSGQSVRPPPPGKSFENGGHWHNGEWHDASHDTDITVDLDDGTVTTYFYNEEIPEEFDGEFVDVVNPLDTIDASHISGDADYIHSYKNLVIGFIQLHADHFPDCQEHEAVMEDAKVHALWTLQKREYDKKSEILDSESDTIDKEFAELTGDDIDKFFERVRNSSASVQKNLRSQLQNLVNKSAELEQKRKELHATRVPYTRPKHLHD